ncbi:MAG TPA: alanine--tRNA ligase [Patescibacteria group bacterium]
MTAGVIKQKFLEFFKEKGHAIIPSASLIPEHDPTVLFTTAGMHPLVPFLMGEKHPAGRRLADVQKSLRTGDIDEVGDAWHLTFFEMLGNWSLGDYFKEEAISWAYEFLTDKKWLGIDPANLYFSVFEGDEDAPRDEEAARAWEALGVLDDQIYYFPKSENWWGPAGETGPCGPDTEIFYDTGREKCGPDCNPSCDCGKYTEIWNIVFMQYLKTKEGRYLPAEQKNIDTGMGLERTAAVLQGKDNAYETELFRPIIDKILDLTGQKSVDRSELILSHQKPIRIIADHLRAAVFILADGVVPSNLDQGYVLRRLIRRAIRHAKMIGIPVEKNLTVPIAEVVIDVFAKDYRELSVNKDKLIRELRAEEEKFEKTLELGLQEFNKLADSSKKEINGRDAFKLFSTYGFPIEITKELALEKKLKVDQAGFDQEFEKHQELSRVGAEKKFKGGLADASGETTKLHTATHLLDQALRDVLGDHVEQRGSNITPKRLRFDFTHPKKMTDLEIKKVEAIVNQKIKEDLPVSFQEMTVKEARELGAIGLFEERYGDRVKVYIIGDYSREICGGPHVTKTGLLGNFKITREESSSAGIRRIKAILD